MIKTADEKSEKPAAGRTRRGPRAVFRTVGRRIHLVVVDAGKNVATGIATKARASEGERKRLMRAALERYVRAAAARGRL